MDKHRQQSGVARPATVSAAADLGWFVIHTKPRQELIALENLVRQGFECYLPMMRVQKIRRGRAEVVSEPMFSRYLFIRLDRGDQGKSWSPIRSTVGVSQMVRFGNEPAQIQDGLIDLLKSSEERRPVDDLFQPGELVVLTEGPFAGIEAIYQSASAEQRSLILIELLSKPVVMKVDTGILRSS